MTIESLDTAKTEQMKTETDASGPGPSSRDSLEEGFIVNVAEGDVHLKRDLGLLGILSAAFNVSNSWLVVAATMVISLGFGPMNTMWGVILVTPIYACVGLTLAELVSAYPTIGGQYHWTSILSPDRFRNILSYCCGFLNWFAWLTMSASSSGAVPVCVFALIMHNNPDFIPANWHAFLIYEAVVMVSFLFNVLGKKIISPFYTVGFILSLAAFLVFTITTVAMQHHKQASSVVWTSYSEISGWSAGVQFLIVLTAPSIAFCPIDGATHLVEEVRAPSKVVPRTMITSLAISFVTSFAFVLAALYCVSDFEAVLYTPSGFPLYEIWRQASSTTTVPVVFTCVVLVLLPIGSIACLQVASMLTMSLGRDNALLFGQYLSRVNSKLNTPVWSLLLDWFILFAMGCLFLFSSFAFQSLVGAAVILQQITVCIPAALLLYHRRSEEALPSTRHFRLPNWLGWTANIVAVAFTAITSTFFLFPATVQVDSGTMNYSVVVSVGSLSVGLINYIFYSRGRYFGPTAIMFHHD